MASLKAVIAMVLTAMLMLGVYIGGAVFGYFLAALTIIGAVLGVVSISFAGLYLGIRKLLDPPKKWANPLGYSRGHRRGPW